jgi:hypothetical protein
MNGTLAGKPENGDVGSYWVNITVDDSNGGIGFRNITVTVRNVNDPPIPLKEILLIQMDEDTVFSLDLFLEFEDPDGDEMEFNVIHQGKITVTVYGDGIMELLPDPNWSGNESFMVYARDLYEEVFLEVNVTVIPVIDAPEDPVISAPPGPFYENTTYPFSAYSSDVDIPYGDILTYTWLLLPTGESWNGSAIELNLTAGNYSLVLNVSDLYGAYSMDLMDLEILKVANQTEPEPDDDDEEPVDDDEEPVDDDEEPVDDDEEPIDDDDVEPVDDDEEPSDDESVDITFVIMMTSVVVGIILIAALIFYLFLKRADPWGMEE